MDSIFLLSITLLVLSSFASIYCDNNVPRRQCFLNQTNCTNAKQLSDNEPSFGPYKIMTPFGLSRETIESIDGIPIAFGDLDQDHLVDIFFITQHGYHIEALHGQSCVDGKTALTYFGSRNCLSKWEEIDCHFPHPIVNLVMSDFTGSNHLDWLVTLQTGYQKYDIILVYGTTFLSDIFECNNHQTLFTDVHSQPFVIDYNGDMISDFIVSTNDCSTNLWIGGTNYIPIIPIDEKNSNESQYILNQMSYCLTNLTSNPENFQFSSPHSSAFLNLNPFNEDITSDLYLNGNEKGHYIFNKPGKGFDPTYNEVIITYPEQTIQGQSIFLDVNYDGTLDHLIPVCMDKKATSFNDCRQIGIMALDRTTKSWFNVLDEIRDDDIVNSKRTLSFSNQSFFGDLEIWAPVTLRVGDLNYDTYPDLVTVFVDCDSSRSRTFAVILFNVAHNDSGTVNPFGRKFKLGWMSDTPENVALATVFDLYNNGRLVVLFTIETNATTYQTIYYDYFIEKAVYYSFLRVSVISGRCSDKASEDWLKCPVENHVALGTNPPGAMTCFEGPNQLDGEHSCSVQLAQSAHFALQLPYIIFGLGEIVNVVNDLKVSIANGIGMEKYHTWNDIIPGSNLVIVPFPIDDPSRWTQRVYINMSIYSIVSLAFLCCLGILLIIAIYILHYQERKEDHKDHIEYKKHWL